MKKNISLLITVNGGKIYVREEHPGAYLSYLFLTTLNLECWSFEALKEFYYGVIELIIEYSIIKREELYGTKKSIFTKFINYGNKNLLKKKFKDRYSVLICIYNLALKFEGLGFLRGFGIVEKGSERILGNPERTSLLINKNIFFLRREVNKKVSDKKQMVFKCNLKKKESKMTTVKLGDIKETIQALNEMDYVEEEIKVTGIKSKKQKDELVKAFIDTVDACPEEEEVDLPEKVIAMYNLLTKDENVDLPEGDEDENSDENGDENSDEKGGENKTECLDFGKGFKKGREECDECKETYPEDYDECKKSLVGTKKKNSTKVKKSTEVKKDKEPRYTRLHAFGDAVKEGGTVRVIIDKSDELYVEKGGISNIKTADKYGTIVLRALDLMGLVAKKGEGIDTKYTLKKVE